MKAAPPLADDDGGAWIPGVIVASAGVAVFGGALAFDIASPTSRNRVVDVADVVGATGMVAGVATAFAGGVWSLTTLSVDEGE